MQIPKLIERAGQHVLTTAQLAECYGADSKDIANNFNNNKSRYEEGKHFYCLKGQALKDFKRDSENLGIAIPKNVNRYYLWTERGALLHAKSLNTDKAWAVYDFLVENYFRTTVPKIPAAPTMSTEQITAKNQAAALYELQKLQAKRAVKEAETAIARADETYFVYQHPELAKYAELLTMQQDN